MRLYAIGLILFCAAICHGESNAIPAGPVPDQFGVNIHFTDARPGELEMLSAAGFRWVRMDLAWNAIEHERGQYDFSQYDTLIAQTEKHGIHTLFIFDYSNRFYDDGLSPHADEGRAAFAKWAAACATHFKGHGILWEMYNEPNGGFWKPHANVEEYAALALAVGKALHEAAPEETYIGPATAGVDLGFIEACFKAGCLDYWSAVSCHPYRQNDPESSAADLRALRALIARYNKTGRHIPIISGEWGFSSAWGNFTPERQGTYLPRELLCNLWQEVPLSIWYDWHDDGPDPREPEHHFGTVEYPYHRGADPVYEPKPAYLAMKALSTELAGFHYNKRLDVGNPNDFILLFSEDQEVRLAAWTTAKEEHPITLPITTGNFAVVGHTGKSLLAIKADDSGLKVNLSGEVQFLIPDQIDGKLRAAADWERAPLEISVHGPAKVNVGGSMIDVGRSPDPMAVRIACPTKGAEEFAQSTLVSVTNPLHLTLVPRSDKNISLEIDNPSGEPFSAKLHLNSGNGDVVPVYEFPIEFKPGQQEQQIALPGKTKSQEIDVQVIQDDQVAVTLPQQSFEFLPDFATGAHGGHTDSFRTHADGNPKIAGETTVTIAQPAEGPPTAGMGCLKLTCDLAPGWKFLQCTPADKSLQSIEGKPKDFGVWVYGDKKDGSTRIRYVDSTGQTFQPASKSISWSGWRFIKFPMQPSDGSTGHWGGANDGVVHYPIRWDTIFLLDKPRADEPFKSEVYISGPVLIR